MKHTLRVLTEEERMMLEVQFLNTPDPAQAFSASGEHYILVDVLNKLGYYPHSREEAYQLAEALLSYTGESKNGYYADLADQA